jgi:hypothetical protein
MPWNMWKVFGEPENIIESGEIWKKQIIELSRRKKGRPRFLEMMEVAEVSHWFDPIEEIHVFSVELPEKFGVDDIEFMKNFIIKIIKGSDEPVISLFDDPQKYTVIITSERENDVYRRMKK